MSGPTARTLAPKHSRHSWAASEQVPKLRLSVELWPKFRRPTHNGFRPSYRNPVPRHTRYQGGDQPRSLPPAEAEVPEPLPRLAAKNWALRMRRREREV